MAQAVVHVEDRPKLANGLLAVLQLRNVNCKSPKLVRRITIAMAKV
jgi:hypothetical protein